VAQHTSDQCAQTTRSLCVLRTAEPTMLGRMNRFVLFVGHSFVHHEVIGGCVIFTVLLASLSQGQSNFKPFATYYFREREMVKAICYFSLKANRLRRERIRQEAEDRERKQQEEETGRRGAASGVQAKETPHKKNQHTWSCLKWLSAADANTFVEGTSALASTASRKFMKSPHRRGTRRWSRESSIRR